MDFQHEPGRIYATATDGTILAEVTFPDAGNIAIINHTFVDPSMRGEGIADKLLSAAVEQIHSDGHKALATCSYAIKWLQDHPEHSDLR